MKKDKFNILYYGKLLPGYQKEAVILQFANTFKISHNKISAWFSGNKVIIKKALPYQKALQYKKAFANLGAVCELQVVTDALSFKNALVKPYSPKNTLLLTKNIYSSDNIAQKKEELPPAIYKFESHFCQPQIFGSSQLMEIKNEKEDTKYEVIAEKKKIGTLGVLGISIMIAFVIQDQLTNLILLSGSSNNLVTIISLITFFSIIYIVPKLLWSKRSYALSSYESDNTEETLNSSLSQNTNYSYFKQKYTLNIADSQTLHIRPRILGAVLGFTGFGLAILTTFPDKELTNRKFELIKTVLVAAFVISCGIICLFSFNQSYQKMTEFRQIVQNNKEHYRFYPNEYPMNENELSKLNDLSLTMIEKGFKLLNNLSLSSHNEAEIMHSMFRIIDWQMMSFNTQRVYYAQDNGIFPYYLSDDYKKEMILQFSQLMNNSTATLANDNLSTIAHDWVYTQRTDKAEMISTGFARVWRYLSEQRHERHSNINWYWRRSRENYLEDKKNDDYDMHSSVELSEFLEDINIHSSIESITELEPGIMSIQLKQEYTGRTLIVAYYHHEYFDPESNQRKDKVSIARIGGDIDNKYLQYGEYSAFFGWPIRHY